MMGGGMMGMGGGYGMMGMSGSGSDRRPGDWDCPACNGHNFASKSACYKCSTPKPNVLPPDPLRKPGDWDCTSCGNNNFASRTACNRCALPKPAELGTYSGPGGPAPEPSASPPQGGGDVASAAAEQLKIALGPSFAGGGTPVTAAPAAAEVPAAAATPVAEGAAAQEKAPPAEATAVEAAAPDAGKKRDAESEAPEEQVEAAAKRAKPEGE